MTGSELIADERQRQIGQEGWTSEHDDELHIEAELTRAAIVYATETMMLITGEDLSLDGWNLQVVWPWSSDDWKPSADPIRNLVKAGALIAAEIDRLQRARVLPCPECKNQFGGKMPGHKYGSNWDWVPCQTCNGEGTVAALLEDRYDA